MLLAAVLCAATVSVNVTPATAAGDCTPAATWPAARTDLAAQVLDLVNAHRAHLGLQPLAVSPTLTAAATWKARNMAAFGYMSHDDPAPVARSPEERLAACGYARASWGENIATGYQTAQDVVNGWLASPGHRENIERPEYRATGIGVAGWQAYWAQSFGTVVDSGSTLSTAAAPIPIPTAVGSSPGGQSSSTHRSVKLRCGLRARHVSCRVGGLRGAMVQIALTRAGRIYARAAARVSSDPARLPLRRTHHLRSGRYSLLVHASLGRSVHERRLSLVVE
ncbi:MAG TPA: CAP domain-containing protein [Solirubrobacteraceae bacterium]